MVEGSRRSAKGPARRRAATSSAPAVPSDAERRYLVRGLTAPGGKLPLYDLEERRIPAKIIEACLAAGWAERWSSNPVKPDWLVCRLTGKGRAAITATPSRPGGDEG